MKKLVFGLIGYLCLMSGMAFAGEVDCSKFYRELTYVNDFGAYLHHNDTSSYELKSLGVLGGGVIIYAEQCVINAGEAIPPAGLIVIDGHRSIDNVKGMWLALLSVYNVNGCKRLKLDGDFLGLTPQGYSVIRPNTLQCDFY